MSTAGKSVRYADLPEAVVASRRRFSIVWVVPLIAALIGGVLAYQTWFGNGPRITIRFEDGTGVSAGQTAVRYHGVECGIVDAVSLDKDLGHVLVRVSLKKEAVQLGRQGARFWIVRPEVSLLGVHGLDTLVSGAYIQAVPGTGAAASTFTGLTDPPPPETLQAGLDVVLQSQQRGALRVGSPVYYRGVEVGKVKSYHLDSSAKSVETTAYIEAEHAALVRTTSRFWNVSGLQMNIGLGGANLDLESIESLLAGGVAFDTPQEGGTPAKSGAIFQLEDKLPAETTASRKAGLRVVLIADRLGGLAVGSAVSYRQVRVGEVEGVRLAPDARRVHVEVRIDTVYRPLVRSGSRFWNVSGVNADVGLSGAKVTIESLQSAISGGIQFATPDESGTDIRDGAIFTLYAKADPAWLEWAPPITIVEASGAERHQGSMAPPSDGPRTTRKLSPRPPAASR